VVFRVRKGAFSVKGRALQNSSYQRGDLVIYTVTKQSAHPGPRAREIHPSQLGEDYSYLVDKFWMVAELRSNEEIVIVTRRGKTRQVSVNDPLLRKANWWQRLRHRNRFPNPEILNTAAASHQ
jgi:hypothetical protein